MLNLQCFTSLKSSRYGPIGMVTRSAWQGYKPQILAALRDLSQILSSYNFRSESLTYDPVSMIGHLY